MRNLISRAVVLAVAAALALVHPLRADEPSSSAMKTVALVKLASYQSTFDNVARIGEMMQNPHLAEGLEAILKLATQNRGAQGLDKERPGGAVIETDGEKLSGYLFLPVTDLKEILVTVEPFAGKPEETDGVYRFQSPRGSLYVTQKGDWAYFAQHAEVLACVAENPLELLGGLVDEYDSAVRFLPQNLPARQRRRAAERLQEAAQRYVDREHEGESDEVAAIRRGATLRLAEIATVIIHDVECVTLGSKMAESGEISVDLTVKALPGSDVANELNKGKMTDSAFAGMLQPEAAVSAIWSVALPAVASDYEWSEFFGLLKTEAFRKIDSQGKGPEVTSASKDFVSGMLAVARDTLSEGQLDGAMSVVLEPDRVVLLSGKNVSSGDEVERALGQLVKAARAENPGFVDQVLETDVAEVNGVRMHQVSVPISGGTPDREKMVRVFGDTLDIVVGIADQAVYLAVGRDALEVLKDAVAKKETQEVPPMTLTLSLQELSEFQAELGKEKERARAAKAAELLKASDAGDTVTLRCLPLENGAHYRLTIDAGVVQMFVRAAFSGGL